MKLYKDAERSIDERVEDLISRMTLQQKITQLQCRYLIDDSVQELDTLSEGIVEVAILSGGTEAEANADFCRAVQDIFLILLRLRTQLI